MASPRGRQPHPLTTSSLPRPGRQRPAGEEPEKGRASPPALCRGTGAQVEAAEPLPAAGRPRTARGRQPRGDPRSVHRSPTPGSPPLLLPPRPQLPEILMGGCCFFFFFNKNNKTVERGEAAGCPGSRAGLRAAEARPGGAGPLPAAPGETGGVGGERPGDSGHLPPGRPPHSLAPARTHRDGETQRSPEPRRPCPAVRPLRGRSRRFAPARGAPLCRARRRPAAPTPPPPRMRGPPAPAGS